MIFSFIYNDCLIFCVHYMIVLFGSQSLFLVFLIFSFFSSAVFEFFS